MLIRCALCASVQLISYEFMSEIAFSEMCNVPAVEREWDMAQMADHSAVNVWILLHYNICPGIDAEPSYKPQLPQHTNNAE